MPSGYAEIGYLPATNVDFNTSVAFQTLTNQMLVVAMKNHKLYKIIKLEATIINDGIKVVILRLI